MSARQLEVIALVAFAVAAVVAVRVGTDAPVASQPRTVSPLEAVPETAAFVATVDLSKVRESELGAALSGPGRELPGLGRLDEVCGNDPTEKIEKIAVAFPPGGRGDELGIVATGSFVAGDIVACASTTLRAKGGDPIASTAGSFHTVRDRSNPRGGEVAAKTGGPVLLAGGSYLREMIDALEGRIPSITGDRSHQDLREVVEEGGAVVATWIAPPGWFESIAGPKAAKVSPLSKVTAAALRVDFAPELRARSVIRCSDTGACESVAEFLRGFRDEELVPLAKRELDLELDADMVGVVFDEGQVLVALRLDAASAKAAFATLLVELTEPVPAPSAIAPEPDEVLRPARKPTAPPPRAAGRTRRPD